jgi:hypothetical protein
MKQTPTGSKLRWFFSKDGYLPEIIIIILVMIASLYVALSPANSLINWYDNDDSFYYFKVAQNIVAGNGVTFDGINATNGFHPLWELICIPVYALIKGDLITPLRVVVILFGIMQSISLVLIYRVFQMMISRLISFMITMAFGFSWLVYTNIFKGGLESALSFLMVIILLKKGIEYHISSDKPLLKLSIIGVIAALTILSRLDNFIFVVFLGVWLVFDRKEDSSLIFVDTVTAILIVTLSAIAATQYGIYPLEKTILVITVILGSVGILSFFMAGLFSGTFFKSRQNSIIRGLFAGAIAVALTIGISYILSKTGIIEGFPRRILFTSGIGWLVYSGFIRGFVIPRLFKISIQTEDNIRIWLKLALIGLERLAAYLLPALILVGIYMTWSQVNFGTPSPVSGQIKHWWGTLENTIYGSPIDSINEIRQYFLGSESPFNLLYTFLAPILLWTKLPDYLLGFISWGILGFGFILLIFAGQKASVFRWSDYLAILPLGTATIFRILYFYISGYVHLRSWYWTIETIFVFLLIAVLIAALWQKLSDQKIIQILLTGSTGLVMLISIVLFFRTLIPTYTWKGSPEHAQDYLLIPEKIETLTEPGSIIGTPGGGTLSYFIKDRVIINLDGLMNSKDYFDDLQKFDTNKDMQRMGIRYIYANEYAILSSSPYAKIFEDHLTRKGKVFNKILYIYQ